MAVNAKCTFTLVLETSTLLRNERVRGLGCSLQLKLIVPEKFFQKKSLLDRPESWGLPKIQKSLHVLVLHTYSREFPLLQPLSSQLQEGFRIPPALSTSPASAQGLFLPFLSWREKKIYIFLIHSCSLCWGEIKAVLFFCLFLFYYFLLHAHDSLKQEENSKVLTSLQLYIKASHRKRKAELLLLQAISMVP